MLFIANSLPQREAYRLKVLTLTDESNITIRYSNVGRHPRWIFSVTGLTAVGKRTLQRWVNRETGFREEAD